MTALTRRALVAGAGALIGLGLAPARASTKAEIDEAVARAIKEMRATVKGASDLMARARGHLIMADVKKAGFVIGGEYGEGILYVGGAPVDYYSVAAASFGLQAGVQRSHHALFFMTEGALRNFRTADGWQAGADVEIVVPEDGIGLNVNTDTANRPVIGFIFGRQGLMAGASLEGAKYSRIYR
ncbi:MAG TPA: lipid-binding SYLF domain-containing protein [Paracoccaceae bacterium]|nr:lipid-binding SYLF domain-containing protein [Paracoccaceae bacterium]